MGVFGLVQTRAVCSDGFSYTCLPLGVVQNVKGTEVKLEFKETKLAVISRNFILSSSSITLLSKLQNFRKNVKFRKYIRNKTNKTFENTFSLSLVVRKLNKFAKYLYPQINSAESSRQFTNTVVTPIQRSEEQLS